MLWWVGPSSRPPQLGTHLKAHGFFHSRDLPGMALDLSLLPEPSLPPGLAIKQVGGIEALRTWCRTLVTGFAFPDVVAHAYLDAFSSLGFDPQSPMLNFSGWLNGEAVATASLFLGGGVAGIYNVTTLSDARCKGIRTAMTVFLLRLARAKGYRVGVLETSKMGEVLYRKLGFRQYCTLSQYVWTPTTRP